MKLHKKLRLYLTALGILAVIGTNAFATCPTVNQGPPCAEFWRADAVFIGVAKSVIRIPNETGLLIGPYAGSTVYFSIEEVFKGVKGSVLVFHLNHCGYLFKEGERYLVYAHYNPHQKELEIRAGQTRTRLLSEAEEDLEYIRNLPSANSGTRIFGSVLRPWLADKEIAFEGLKDLKVVLESDTERRGVVTDRRGRFEFKSIPAGNYRIRVEVPANLTTKEQAVEIIGQGCVLVDLFANPKPAATENDP